MKTSAFVLIILVCGILVMPDKLQAQADWIQVEDLTATFDPKTGKLTGWTAKLSDFASTPITDTVEIQYYESNGVTPIGAPVRVSADLAGKLKVQSSTIPAGASEMQCKLVIKKRIPGPAGGVLTSKPIVWYKGAWGWGEPVIKVDPTGFPGTGTQHWFIQGAPILIGQDAEFGTRQLSVVHSGFDLTYSATGGNTYDLTVTGEDSFLRLSDGTYVSFADGSKFGTMDIPSGATSGDFNFYAVGLFGVWSFDGSRNYVDATSTTTVPWSEPAISMTPEPSGVSLTAVALSLFGLWWAAVKRKGKRVITIDTQG